MFTDLLITSAITIFAYMIIFYIIAQAVRDNSIVDIGWGLGFIVVTLVLMFSLKTINLSEIIMLIMIVAWGLRLGVYIFIRNVGKGEDFRYANWRKKWGKKAWIIAFFKVFMLQGIVMFIVSLPIVITFYGDVTKINVFHYIGIGLFIIGYCFEVIGDYQLSRFKKKPENKGKIITHGLWRYTRHPNYFGEAVIWWGIFFVALSSDFGWISIVSPLIMTLTLMFASGVPMLEKKYEGREDWEEYKKKTPKFFPFIKFSR